MLNRNQNFSSKLILSRKYKKDFANSKNSAKKAVNKSVSPPPSDVPQTRQTQHKNTELSQSQQGRPDSIDDSSGRLSLVKSRIEETPRYNKNPVYFQPQPVPTSYKEIPVLHAKPPGRNIFTQTDSLDSEQLFFETLPDTKLQLIKMVMNLNLEKESMFTIREILQKFSNSEPSTKRNISFINSLLDNENIGLLQDATNNGETIEKELVIYIKKIQNADMQGNKVELAKQMLDEGRMTRDDSMAHSYQRKKTRILGGSNQPKSDLVIDPMIKQETEKQNVEEIKEALEDLVVNQNLQAYKNKYIENLKKEHSPSKSKQSLQSEARAREREQRLRERLAKKSREKQPKAPLIEPNPVRTDEDTIIRLYQYLTKAKGYLKKFHKYPFRSVETLETAYKEGTLDTDLQSSLLAAPIPTGELATITTFDYFKKRFLEVVAVHKACGDMCPHLRRFYERIGFDPYMPDASLEVHIPRVTIDKIILGDIEQFVNSCQTPN